MYNNVHHFSPAVYASLGDAGGGEEAVGDGGSGQGLKRRSDDDDDLWRPQGDLSLPSPHNTVENNTSILVKNIFGLV